MAYSELFMENLSAASKLANQVQFHLKIYLILSLNYNVITAIDVQGFQ